MLQKAGAKKSRVLRAKAENPGASHSEIARTAGCSTSYARSILLPENWQPPERTGAEEKRKVRDEIIRLWSQNPKPSLSSIGRATGRSVRQVSRLLTMQNLHKPQKVRNTAGDALEAAIIRARKESPESSLADIARKTGSNPAWIKQILTENGIALPPKARPKEETSRIKEEAIRMWNSVGQPSTHEIARATGRSPARIRAILREARLYPDPKPGNNQPPERSDTPRVPPHTRG